jgi:hypothetical protein
MENGKMLKVHDIDLESRVIKQIWGHGYRAPDDRRMLRAAILELAGNPLPQHEMVTRLIFGGKTWGGLTEDERKFWPGSAQFARHRSEVLAQLRIMLAPAKEHLVPLLDLPVPHKTFTYAQMSEFFDVSLDWLKVAVQKMADTEQLLCPVLLTKHIREFHMPKRPLLVDFLLMSQEEDRVETFLKKWPTVGLSRCQMKVMRVLGNPNTTQSPAQTLGWTRTNWSFHKQRAFKKLGLDDLPSPGPRRIFRWPDAWAWRAFICEGDLDGIDEECRKFDELAQRIWGTLTNNGNPL